MEIEIREYQLYLKTILDKVVRICEGHGITYYLSSGTLLGAIRHKGFIPWDDDVDIDIPIEEYGKFCRINQKEFEQVGLFLQTYKTDPQASWPWAMVRANGTTSMPIAESKWDIHWGIHIDVFPLVGLYQNETLRKLQYRLFGVARQLLQKDRDDALGTNMDYSPKIRFLLSFPRWARHFLADIMFLYIDKNFKKSQVAAERWCRMNPKYRPEYFKEKTKVLFEGTWYWAPLEYDKHLTKVFGDYMTPPPPEKRGGHDMAQGKTIRDIHKDYREYKKELL